jgi:hypothetical protein
MKGKTAAALLAALFLVAASFSGAMAAKLICVSHEDLKGEMTVKNCLDQKMEFAIIDSSGFVRVLTSREIELTKRINPKAFETPGYGVKFLHLAPEIPPLPVSPEKP